MDVQLVYIALAALLGAITVSLLGWAESNEKFNSRKFFASLLRGLIASVAFAIGVSVTGPTSWLFYFGAFLGGAGADALGKRAQAVLR